ncbi:MAG: PLDc N-terminal domain-containing protein [bacterium]
MKPIITILTLSSLGWLWLLLVIFGTLIGVGGTVLWIWMLIEVLTRETDENNNRLIWALVIIFTHWLGALIYLIVRRAERIKKLGR